MEHGRARNRSSCIVFQCIMDRVRLELGWISIEVPSFVVGVDSMPAHVTSSLQMILERVISYSNSAISIRAVSGLRVYLRVSPRILL